MLKPHVLATLLVRGRSAAADARSQSACKAVLHTSSSSTVSGFHSWHTGTAMVMLPSLCAEPSADAPRIYCDFEKPRLPVKLIEHSARLMGSRRGRFPNIDMTVRTLPDGSRAIASGFGWMNSYNRALTDITESPYSVTNASDQSLQPTAGRSDD